jgi:perosamine synthetase
MRKEREAIAKTYQEELANVEEIETPIENPNRIHSWHLYPLRLRLERLSIDRNEFIEKLKSLGIGCSVHWRPLHLHPYYREIFEWRPEDFQVATAVWERLISLPIFQGMRSDEIRGVINAVRKLCLRHGRH